MAGVDRPRLHLSLEAAVAHRVCVVTGAAGWGKTMAVASWSRSAPTVWMRPESRDRAGGGFAHRLTDSLRDRVSAPPVCLSDPVTVEGADAYVDACCRWLSQTLTDDLVLVIDDLQNSTPDPVAMRILAGLCRGGPDRLHLLLLSRCEPPFSLERLRGRGLVAEIDARDLAFDVDEVAQLLQAAVGTHPAGLAEQVWLHTGGWPAAISLVVETLRYVKPGRWSSLLPQLMQPLRYLVEEVIEREPGLIRQVLHRMAVSGEKGAAAATVTGDGEDPSCVADLVRRGLVHAVQGHVDRWSLVAPVQHYFDQQLSPASRVLLHRRAARDHLGRGAIAEALWHLRASGDHSACASLLVDHGDELLSSGRFDVVLEAAELPTEYLADERIQRVVGQAWQSRGQWASARECFRRAGDARGELEPALAWRVALVFYGQARFDEVLAVCARARLAAESTMDEVRVLSLAANACRMVGDYAGCRGRADRAMAAAEWCGQPAARALGYAAQTKLAFAEGDQRRADGYSQSAIEAAEAAGDLLQSHWAQIVRAFQLADTGQSEAALAHIEGVLQLGESCAERHLWAQALNLRGTVLTHQGLVESALDDLAASRDLYQQLGSGFLAWPLCGLGDINRVRGQLTDARALYEEALALAEPCHDVLALGSALTGLARVRAVDDTAAARELAERALALGEGARAVQARLTRGWITLMEGDHQTAAVDAALAADTARARCDNPGLAEALMLAVLAAAQPSQHRWMLAEAIQILREAGRPVEEAQVRLVDAHLGRGIGAEVVRAERTVRDYGVHTGPGAAAGPFAVLTRFAPSVSIHALGTFQ
ncbi:MAG: tetratricopeptide repeat protein, partial [Actinomycetota bacterium]|nr:tetratricopeptide repeat protein [Actinomycetota bacterium]